MKTLLQCDFDGTITEEDISFLILDAFANSSWRQLLAEYRAGQISVGRFNAAAFGVVRADRKTLVDFVRRGVRLKSGFCDLVSYCQERGFRFVITSNGLDFYIETILEDAGVRNIEVMAARTIFKPGGLAVQYIGPDGKELQDSFKEAYTRMFLEEGYRVIYIGNGLSDVPAAKLAHHVFAREDLLAHCEEYQLACIRFEDLNDVRRGLELMEGSQDRVKRR
ncbi:MAG: MtnX-like HAD-IB family phosphatase [Chloroflexi bacterium]|nr:MtnX-like HAD-IB family phosphatase [Chloroflexota bacterium]